MLVAYKVPREEYKLLFKDSKLFKRFLNYIEAIHFDDCNDLYERLDIRVVKDDKDKSIHFPIDEINSYKGDWVQVNGVVYQDKHGNRQIDVDINELFRVILTWFCFKSVNNSFFVRVYLFYYKYIHSDNNYDDIFYILPDKYHNIIMNILNRFNMNLDTYIRKETIKLTKAKSIYDK
nr:MAG TPA: hypothetical protein [Caudoviricetes sp.]